MQSPELPNIMDPFPGRLPVSDTEPVFLFFENFDSRLMVDNRLLDVRDLVPVVGDLPLQFVEDVLQLIHREGQRCYVAVEGDQWLYHNRDGCDKPQGPD